ncbi:hypothetical protein AAFF_G00279720 [Aldrovandia affinis]|uniref:Uncharacterized protein n=1 Tax=Aldrovandia affinis TaxID=143900 RepID=A0AAD7WSI0_9TELE|nr:hypothetical protein AAFF_G00279720 [Aldrovandia affinis]
MTTEGAEELRGNERSFIGGISPSVMESPRTCGKRIKWPSRPSDLWPYRHMEPPLGLGGGGSGPGRVGARLMFPAHATQSAPRLLQAYGGQLGKWPE